MTHAHESATPEATPEPAEVPEVPDPEATPEPAEVPDPAPETETEDDPDAAS